MDLLRDLDRRIAYGVVGGTFAGLLFLLANMWYADSQGLPAVAPSTRATSAAWHFYATSSDERSRPARCSIQAPTPCHSEIASQRSR